MLFSKIKGSSLLTALIFSFVLMVIVSAIAYNFRVGSLAVTTLINEERNINIDEGYIKNLADSGSLAIAHDETINNFRLETTPDSMIPKFYVNNTNVSLYSAEPFIFSYDVTHNFYNNGVNEYTKNIIFNTLIDSVYTQYDEDLCPINVPYVNTAAMSDNFAYRFAGDDSISQPGYVGYIQRNSSTLEISAEGNNTTVNKPLLLSSEYKFSLGWDLRAGSWYILLAVYDADKVYTSSTLLNNIMSNSAQAKIDLENWHEVTISVPAESTVSSGSVILTRWYHDSGADVPKPLILKKDEQSDTPGTYYLNFYNSTYNSGTEIFSALLSESVSTTNDFDVTKVFMTVPDKDFNLDASIPLVFMEDGSSSKVYQYNLHNLKTATYLGTLSTSVSQEPVLVKKNNTQSYLIYHNGKKFYIHDYTAGTLNVNEIVPGGQSFLKLPFYSQELEKIIPKFGALFIVTENNIYIDDFGGNTQMVNKISRPGGASEFQILRDNDGLIYIMPDGLTCQINGSCDEDDRLYIRDEGNCAGYTGGCDFIDELNNIGPYLGMVYKNIQQ